MRLNHARKVSWGQCLSNLWNYFKDYKTGCHFLFENEFENHKSKLPVDRTWILACSFWFWPHSQLFYRLHWFLHLFQKPLSGGLFGCLTSEKRGDATAQKTVIPQQIAGPLKFMDAGQTVLEQRVLMLSSLLLKQCPAGIGKWKPFYQTFLKKETLQENQTLAFLVSIFLNIKAHILKIVYGSCFSQKNPAGHWMSLLLQKNTPESSQIRLWIRWGEVTQTWKWPFLSVNQHSTGGTWRLPCPCEQLEATNSMVLRSPSPSEGKSSMELMELMDLNSPVPRCASPLLASSPLVLPRCVPAEPLGPHNTSSLVSSLDSTLSLLPYSGAHCNKHVSKLAFNPRSRTMHHHGEPRQCRQWTFSRSALRLTSFPLWKPEKQAPGVHKTLSDWGHQV